jgi:Tol biopolymer transport system component
VRPLDSPAAQPLARTQGARHPFWSPDSSSIAFFADGKLKRMEISGGPAVTLAEAPNPHGGSWSPKGVIIFAPSPNLALQRVAEGGGVPAAATTLEPGHDYYQYFPWFLPDGRHFLFGDRTQQNGSDVMLLVGALDSREVKTIGPASSSNAVYSSGYVLFLRENTLMARPFDEKRLATTGDAVPVAEQVRSMYPGSSAVGVFAVSQEGLLAYQAGPMASQQLTWFDRSGKPVGTLGDAGELWSVDFSPDRKRVAVTVRGQNDDIWIYDVARGLATRFTFSPAAERNPIWSPDGQSVVYDSDNNLYRKAADGTGNEELLYADGVLKVPESWSPDGKFLLYGTREDVWVLPLGPKGASGAPSNLFPLLAPQLRKYLAKFSPDGHWVAYVSNESGRGEIYVAPFPGPGAKRQISNGGGTFPRWRADGKEIFYELNGTLMAAEISIKSGSVEVGAIRSLGIPVTWPAYRYDVSTDGQRFLVATTREQNSPAPLTLVQNWTALLKKK